MNVRSIINVTQRYVIDNSPTLLTAFGVTGTLATAYLTGKATFKAADILRKEAEARVLMEKQPPPPTKKQQVGMVWKCYIPPAITVVSTVGCIVAANTISMSRAAAMAAAYTMADKNFAEYKEKVKEIIGEKKEGEVRAGVAQDLVNNNPPSGNVINAAGGETLCLDRWTGRYFYSDMQTIRAAENDLAKGMYLGQDVATLADFYDAIRLPVPKCAEEVGWNNDAPLKLSFDTVLAPGDVPCLVMDFATTPFPIRAYFGDA